MTENAFFTDTGKRDKSLVRISVLKLRPSLREVFYRGLQREAKVSEQNARIPSLPLHKRRPTIGSVFSPKTEIRIP